jgi:hypothetical protein
MAIDISDDEKWAAYLQKLERQEQRGRFPKPKADPGDIEFHANIARRHVTRDFKPYDYSSGSAAKDDAE